MRFRVKAGVHRVGGTAIKGEDGRIIASEGKNIPQGGTFEDASPLHERFPEKFELVSPSAQEATEEGKTESEVVNTGVDDARAEERAGYEKETKESLVKMATELDIPATGNMTKAQIIDALLEATSE